MNIGYARVSTEEQNPNGQVKELEKVCDKVELEYASGGRWDRPQLQSILRGIKAGDCLTVWKLDRLTRSLSDLLQILRHLEEAGASFRSLTESINTGTPLGRMLTQLLGVFAEFERAQLKERTRLGLARARAEGRIGGNRHSLTLKQQEAAVEMVNSGKSQSEVATLFSVHRSTIHRLLQERRVLAA
jgi:DNA invertase Pin-like site-specific DNA recombinase